MSEMEKQGAMARARVRLDLDMMRSSILHALEIQHDDVSNYVSEAINSLLSEGAFEAMITDAVKESMAKAVRQEVESFFTMGPGRVAIKKITKAALASHIAGMEDDYGSAD